MKLFRLFSLIAIVSLCSAQTEIAIDSLRLDLPVGYQHKPGKGVDSTPGSIVTKAGSIISYDLGIGAGDGHAARIRGKKGVVIVADERIENALGGGELVVIKLADKFGAVFDGGAGVKFYSIELGESELQEFRAIIKSFRLANAEEETK